MSETQQPTHTATIVLPESVAAFFDVLNTVGTKVSYSAPSTHAKVRLTANDLYDLATQVRSLEYELVRATGVPATIERPTETEGGSYLATVRAIDDVRSFFEALTGLAAVRFDPIEDRATVDFFEDDEYDLATTVAALNDELASIFGASAPRLDRPQRVA